MSEQGEDDATLSDNTPREEDGKEPKTIRIAMFFDGTLNNRLNIAEREKGSSIYDQKHGKGDNSYDNGRTNIALMEPHVTGTSLAYHLYYKSYIEGQGTFDLGEDDTIGYAMGGGESGVVDRADKGVSRMVELIDRNKKVDKKKNYIKKITVDVFGFSRGAATARYAIHVLLYGDSKYNRPSLAERLRELDYDIWNNAVEVRFAGLYDTVLSYWGTQYVGWTKLKQNAIVHVKKKVLHLAAADEHRKDFGLHNIKSVQASGKGEEYYLPGVHSDVGGSYNLASEEAIKKQQEPALKEYMKVSDEIKNINTGNLNDLEQDRQYLIKQGWGTDKEIKQPVLIGQIGDSDIYRMSLERKAVKSAYNNIPLKIMADYIKADPVLLTVDAQLYDRAKIILNPEADLQKLEERILKYIESKKKTKDSKDTDWIGIYADTPSGSDAPDATKKVPNPLNDDLMRKIRREHFHFSSKLGLGYNPHFEYDPTLGHERRTREINDG